MENQPYPTWKHALTYGVYIGIALIILSLVFYVTDLYTERWVSSISYAVLLAGVVLSSLYFRNQRSNGFITYGKSFSVGFVTGIFASIIAAIFTYIFMTILGEDFTKVLLENAEEEMLKTNPNMTDEQIDMAINWTKKMMQPAWMSVMAFLAYTFFSLIFSLIGSIFIKKEEQI